MPRRLDATWSFQTDTSIRLKDVPRRVLKVFLLVAPLDVCQFLLGGHPVAPRQRYAVIVCLRTLTASETQQVAVQTKVALHLIE
ncbi:hypothetical protein HYQ46_012584 [Verticillium longisporum]|nr:hypothetical protein HYQ46_012584 [Verticillium longisporum]